MVITGLLLLVLTGCGRSSGSRAMPDEIFVGILNQKGMEMIMVTRDEAQKYMKNGGDPAQALAQSRKMFSPETVAEYKTLEMTSAQIAYMQLAALNAIENATYTGTMFSSGPKVERRTELNKLREDCIAAYTNAFAVFVNDPKADVNWRDWKGMTFLMNMALRGQTELVKALIAKGANVNLQSNEGKTAADYAQENKHSDVVELLRAAGATIH